MASKTVQPDLSMRIPGHLIEEADAICAQWTNEEVPRMRVIIAAIRIGLEAVKGFSPHEVYAYSHIGLPPGMRVAIAPEPTAEPATAA
jgi:hypothetical protein